jgi:Zn-dependent M16 (insulinase) family peptidase
MRRIRGCDAKWFSGITYETRKRVRHEILNTTNEDLIGLAEAVRKALDSAAVCVIGPEDALKRCGIETIHSI